MPFSIEDIKSNPNPSQSIFFLEAEDIKIITDIQVCNKTRILMYIYFSVGNNLNH